MMIDRLKFFSQTQSTMSGDLRANDDANVNNNGNNNNNNNNNDNNNSNN